MKVNMIFPPPALGSGRDSLGLSGDARSPVSIGDSAGGVCSWPQEPPGHQLSASHSECGPFTVPRSLPCGRMQDFAPPWASLTSGLGLPSGKTQNEDQSSFLKRGCVS